MKEIKILKQVFTLSNWDTVNRVLHAYYPKLKENDYLILERIFKELQRMDVIQNQCGLLIHITRREDELEPFDVFARKYEFESSDGYDISYVKWEQWLGFQIAQEVLESMSLDEIIAHCLYEMTWNGFSQEVIEDQLKKLKKE